MTHKLLRSPEGEASGGESTATTTTESEPKYNPFQAAEEAGELEPPDGFKAGETEAKEDTSGNEEVKEKTPEEKAAEEDAAAKEIEAKAKPAEATAEQIAETVKKLGLTLQPATAAKETEVKQLSPEELDKAFGVFHPSEEHVNAILEGGPNAIKALDHIVQNAVSQAVTTAKLYMKVMENEIRAELNPVRENMATANRKALEGDFLSKWPDAPKYEAILRPYYQELVNKKANFETMDAAVDHMKKYVEGVLGKAIPGFKLSNGASSTTGTTTKSTQKMAQARSGGQGGGSTGASGSAKPKENATARALFG